jgi:hypothetical protein
MPEYDLKSFKLTAGSGALKSTVEKLQLSAQELLDEMIRLTEPREQTPETRIEAAHV